MIQINLIDADDNLHLHLQNVKLYVYKSLTDWQSEKALADCTLKLMVNGQPIVFEIRDGYLQNFSSRVFLHHILKQYGNRSQRYPQNNNHNNQLNNRKSFCRL